MRNLRRLFAVVLTALVFSNSIFAQQATIKGHIVNAATSEGLGAVSVAVKNGKVGTFTNPKGDFSLTVPALPVTLVISSIGFDMQEVTVSESAAVNISLAPTSQIGQEVVVSATRSAQNILEAPVTVERLNSVALRAAPAPSYYEAIANLKGVDMHTSSLTFRTITTRGFISSGNVRLNQLVDGMDNMAPGLNFSVGSVIGLSELDVDNMELLAGASSALYGSGGMNGTLLINSKNPFKYQGLSFQVKQGVMHLNDTANDPSPYYDWSVRYAKAFNDKFAFKITGQYIKANDWEANDYGNVLRSNVLSKQIPGDRASDPNYDGINMYGDETTANIRQLVLAAYQANPSAPTLFGVPTAYALANTPNQNVSRTGYREKDLVNYNTENLKVTGGIHYKITPGIEASFNSYFGTGTTVYTGADRYSLTNLKMAQHKLEVRAKNWFVRGYTTQENAGDAYQATALGRILNETWKPTLTFAPNGFPAPQPTDWLVQYMGNYLGYKYAIQQGTGSPANETVAHNYARGQADVGRLLPGTPGFDNAVAAIKSRPIPQGAKFLDRSDLWAAEAQLNFSDQFNFSNLVEVIGGVQWKEYVLNSQGTLFADTAGTLKPRETGGYLQLRKKLLNDILTLTVAGRYDKHINFDGRFTPRVAAVIKVAQDNNIRLSYQTAYRFPTNQDQYINLYTGSAFLIGSIPAFQTYYRVPNNPTYTAESITAARATLNPALLVKAPYTNMRPESVASYEIGYKGVIARRLLIDLYGYYSQYKDFLGRIAVGQSAQMNYGNGPASGTASPTDVLNPLTTRNLSYLQNIDQKVKAIGWGLSLDYQLMRGYYAYGNVYSDELRDVPDGVVTQFNAPKYRFNLGVRNESVIKNLGFNIVYKWQDEVYYESTFATGTLPSVSWLDAQVSYKMPAYKIMFRLGGTNILNHYNRTAFGNPYVGGLYYASIGYNLF